MTHSFLSGMACLANLFAAIIFVRFYLRTADRLFVYLSVSFLIQGLNRVAFLMLDDPVEAHTFLYGVRALAFGLIVVGVVDKNLSARSPGLLGGADLSSDEVAAAEKRSVHAP